MAKTHYETNEFYQGMGEAERVINARKQRFWKRKRISEKPEVQNYAKKSNSIGIKCFKCQITGHISKDCVQEMQRKPLSNGAQQPRCSNANCVAIFDKIAGVIRNQE